MSERATVPVGDGLVARVEGEGPKVLWLHGYTLDSTSWREMWRRLPGWQHIGMDLPAHGLSAPILDGENLATLARKVAAFCRAQDVRHLVALSFGTLTATQIMIEEPEHFRSITLGAPSLAGGPQDPQVAETYGELGMLYARAGLGPHLTEAWMRCIAWRGVEKQPALEEEMRALVGRHRWSELADWGMVRLLQPEQTEDGLRRVRTPVLIVIGALDLPAFHECADILERSLPDSRRLSLPDTGHLCMLESPAPSAAAIEEHLTRYERGPAVASESATA